MKKGLLLMVFLITSFSANAQVINGIGKLRLDMTLKEVRAILGSPVKPCVHPYIIDSL